MTYAADRALSRIFYRAAKERGAKCVLDDMGISYKTGLAFANGSRSWPVYAVQPLYRVSGDILAAQAVIGPDLTVVTCTPAHTTEGMKMATVRMIKIMADVFELAEKIERQEALTDEEFTRLMGETYEGAALLAELRNKATQAPRKEL